MDNGKAKNVTNASGILRKAGDTMLDKIVAGKKVLYIAPPSTKIVDEFMMPDNRMLCPHFDRLKFGSNGCPFLCDWCYLKLTYRAAFPFITIYVGYHIIEKQLQKRLDKATAPCNLQQR